MIRRLSKLSNDVVNDVITTNKHYPPITKAFINDIVFNLTDAKNNINANKPLSTGIHSLRDKMSAILYNIALKEELLLFMHNNPMVAENASPYKLIDDIEGELVFNKDDPKALLAVYYKLAQILSWLISRNKKILKELTRV